MKIFFLILSLSLSFFASQITTFKVEGMHCPLCTTAVKKAIKKLDGVEKVSARLNTKEVKVTHKKNLSTEKILEAIKTTSYKGIIINKTN